QAQTDLIIAGNDTRVGRRHGSWCTTTVADSCSVKVRQTVGRLDVVQGTSFLHAQGGNAQVTVVFQCETDQCLQALIREEVAPPHFGHALLLIGRCCCVLRIISGDRCIGTHIGGSHRAAAQYARRDQRQCELLHHISSSSLRGLLAAYMRRWRSLPLNMLRTTTKNTGTRNTASTVAVIMPPITPVPIARWLAEPAPEAITSGSTPRMKASEVMMIGRKRRCTASSVASINPLPCACRSLANSMIRIAFFADRPTTAIM